MYDASRSTSSGLIVVALVCAGIGLLIVLVAAAPRALVSARWAPGLEDHRLDIAFVGIAITAGLVIAVVLSSSRGA
jgi:hypothetical protein